MPASASPGTGTVAAVQAIASGYRSRLRAIAERAALPYDLPEPAAAQQVGVVAGQLKPVLLKVLKPMGYTCQGGSGTFTLRRKTQANLTVELYLDVGTWSRKILAIFQVLGVGFKANVSIPVAMRALDSMQRQYPVGDAENWRMIVENLGALVRELDRTLVPEIEQAAGPSPEWFAPET